MVTQNSFSRLCMQACTTIQFALVFLCLWAYRETRASAKSANIDMLGMQVTASSPVCRNTDPKALVSRSFLRMNFAGPSTVDGQAQTWWQVDLGQRHSLTCNYYTLRQDGSQDFVRSWVMQVRALILSSSSHLAGSCSDNAVCCQVMYLCMAMQDS